MSAPPRDSGPPIDVDARAGEVRERLNGPHVAVPAEFLLKLAQTCELHTDDDALVAASRDWWPISLRWALHGRVASRPAVVACPRSTDEVASVLRLCNDAGIPVTPAGGRSGVCGGAVPVFGGVALDMRGMAGIASVDSASGLVDVHAGTYGPDLEDALRRDHGLTLGHWPQSFALSTVGGWVACRAAGQYSTRYGKMEDIVAGLEVVLADGRVVRTGALAGAGPRSAMGPDLTQLFLGAEGTLGVVTRARLRARPLPPAERRAAWVFDSFAAGIDALQRTLRRGATPAVVRLYDTEESKRNFGVDGGHLLIALDEGEARIIDAAMHVLTEECSAATPHDTAVVAHWLEKRNDVSALETVTRMGVVVDTVEVSAPWSQLGGLYGDAVAALQAIDGTVAASAHESHAYPDGACLYFTFAGLGPDPADDAWAEAFYRSAWDAIMAATRAHGGSISHHHGIGIVRARHLAGALGEGFAVLSALKQALDPRGILNPGKLGLPSQYGPPTWP
jgi:alkyldihydroxyacetonephosphate synthase